MAETNERRRPAKAASASSTAIKNGTTLLPRPTLDEHLNGPLVDGDQPMVVSRSWLHERLGWKQPCPPEHAMRLEAAGQAMCRNCGCPLCATSMHFGLGHHCVPCADATQACWEFEETLRGLVADPYCFAHGTPTPETWKHCELCNGARHAAKREGWKGQPTGHYAFPDCVHCEICGECQGSGRVCSDCYRCLRHEPPPRSTGAGCERTIWDRVAKVERDYFDHRVYNKTTGRWSV